MARIRGRKISGAKGLRITVPVAALGLFYGTAPGVADADAAQQRNSQDQHVPRVGDKADPINFQTSKDARAEDLSLVAKAHGWTLDQAAADHRAAEVVGAIAVKVSIEEPNAFVGSALSPEPGGTPALYIKGRASERVQELVAAAEVEVRIVDEQPFSFDELEERKLRVHRSLEAQGFKNISSGFSIRDAGRIKAGVTRQAGLASNEEEIKQDLPSDLRDGVDLTVNDVDIAVDERAFGGMRVSDTGPVGALCTSGWSVQNGAGTRGVTTAGHCDSIDRITDPAGPTNHALTHQQQHRGQWGDVEWLTSNQDELAIFYSDADTTREVNAVEARAAISEDESVCQYGRSSNDRDCSLEVQDVSQACTNEGVFNDRLVLMNGDTGIGGDSGGGWSFNNTGFGGHKGNCADVPGREVWSVADLFDEAIGVTVRTK